MSRWQVGRAVTFGHSINTARPNNASHPACCHWSRACALRCLSPVSQPLRLAWQARFWRPKTSFWSSQSWYSRCRWIFDGRCGLDMAIYQHYLRFIYRSKDVLRATSHVALSTIKICFIVWFMLVWPLHVWGEMSEMKSGERPMKSRQFVLPSWRL